MSTLKAIQTNLAKISPSDIEVKLETSEKVMNDQANSTLLKVQKAVGLRA